MPRMHSYLSSNGTWSQLVEYSNITLRLLLPGRSVKLGGLSVNPFLVPHRDEFSETVGYTITGMNKSALFIPDINKWARWELDIAEVVDAFDCVLCRALLLAAPA